MLENVNYLSFAGEWSRETLPELGAEIGGYVYNK